MCNTIVLLCLHYFVAATRCGISHNTPAECAECDIGALSILTVAKICHFHWIWKGCTFMLHCLDTLDHRITNYSILLAHSWITANFLFVNKPSEPIMNWLSRRRQTLHSSGQIQVQFHNQRKLDRPKKRIAHCSRHVALSLAHVAIKFISKGVPCKNFQLGFVTKLTIARLFASS